MPGEGQTVFFKVVTLYKSNNLQPMAMYLRVCKQHWDSACLKIKWEHRVRWIQSGSRYRGSKMFKIQLTHSQRIKDIF